MKIELIIVCFFIFSPVCAEVFTTESGDIKYLGLIDETKNNSVIKLYSDLEVKPNRLIISSQGGSVELGIKLAEWVLDNKIIVEIADYCISSCANYVFLAGKKKVLNKNSLLGWHGGLLQRSDLPFLERKYLVDVSRLAETCSVDEFIEKYKNKFNFSFDESFNKLVRSECQFFKTAGIDYSILIFGHHLAFYPKTSDADIWSYSVEALTYLGVKDIILKDGEWLPPREINGKRLYYFEVADLATANIHQGW